MILNENIIEELMNKNCIKIGNFKLNNGDTSKYYFDMKNLISHPELLKTIGNKIYESINKECTLICGVPMGGLPIASYISTQYNIPMIIVRDKPKNDGTCKQIEGNYSNNDKCVIIDDVITTGKSIQNIIKILYNKVNIIGINVILDRQQRENLNVSVNAILTKTDIVAGQLNIIKRDKKSRLCFSADIEDEDKLFEILESIGKYIVICKIHFDIFNKTNNNSFKEKLIDCSIKHNFLLMEDRKFLDISYITNKQYKFFQNWIDIVTVMGFVNEETIKNMSGVLLVANMSNNIWDLTNNVKLLEEKYSKNILGFVTQHRIKSNKFTFTPGISLNNTNIDDQNYRNIENIDCDIIIIGRSIYNSINYIEMAKLYSLM
jgi:uridine monophosphate synthetase